MQLGLAGKLITLGCAALVTHAAYGQDYPTRPVHMLVGGSGSASDAIARLIAQGISGPLGQQVIVDNREALISSETLAKAPPDGYTLFFSGSAPWITPLLQKTSWDPLRDFAPVILATTSPFVLVVHPSVPAKSVKELIALARARPGELNYSSGATGGGGHIGAELFNGMAGIAIERINYKSAAWALNGLLVGEVQVMFNNTPPTMPHVQSGKLRALASTSVKPSVFLPNLPTVAATLPGYEYASVYGVLARAGTPAAIVTRLNQEIARVLAQPAMRQNLLNSGVEVVNSSPEQFSAEIRSDMARSRRAIDLMERDRR